MKHKNILLRSALCLLVSSAISTSWAASAPLAIGSTLEEFYNGALESSPDLSISKERWNINTARKDSANGQLLPQIMATANMSENDRTANGKSATYNGERYSVQLSQVLFNWQAFAARSRAYLLEDEAEAEYYAQLSFLLTDVADKYLAVLQAEDTLNSIVSQHEAMENQVKQLQSLFDRQLVQVTDLYAAQARLASIVSERVEAESNLELSRGALRALTNLETGNLMRLPTQVTVKPLEGSMSDWVARTLENNFTIEARAYAYQAANKQVSEQRGTYMPRVSLIVQQQNSNLGYDNVLVDKSDSTYFGIDFQVPLFSGGSRRAGVREAQSMRSIAQSELRRTQLEMTERARTAFLQVKAGESRIEAGQILMTSTETAYTAMQRGFELGTVTSVDLLNALNDRFQAQRNLQQARYDHIRANLLLRREAGALSAEDLMDISSMLDRASP